MSNGVPKSILIIDDDAEVVETLSRALGQGTTYRIQGATSVIEAFRILATDQVDLTVCDYVMPGMDGINLVKQARSRLPDLAVIFVTAHEKAEFEAEAETLKALAILPKPINAGQLRAIIQRHFGETIAAPAAPSAVGDKEKERSGFTGQLEQFQLVDILQMCCLGRRTGRLILNHGEERGFVYLDHGNIVHAECEGRDAEEAVYRIVGWDYGKFQMEEGSPAPRRSIETPWDAVIMEGVRRKDERKAEGPKVVESDNLVGTTIGSYEIKRELGGGTWGKVYEAVQTGIGRAVALKVLSRDRLNDPLAVEQFIASASVMANLQHPNIVTIYEAGEAGGLIYYAMEFVKGAGWEQLQRAGEQFTVAQAIQLLKSIARALSFLEHNHITRRAITPRQVLIQPDGEAKLCDFGLHEGVAIGSGLGTDLQTLGRELKRSVRSLEHTPVAWQQIIKRLVGEDGQMQYMSIDSLFADLAGLEQQLTTSVPKVVVAQPVKSAAPVPSKPVVVAAATPKVAVPSAVAATSAPAIPLASPKVATPKVVASPAATPSVVPKPVASTPASPQKDSAPPAPKIAPSPKIAPVIVTPAVTKSTPKAIPSEPKVSTPKVSTPSAPATVSPTPKMASPSVPVMPASAQTSPPGPSPAGPKLAKVNPVATTAPKVTGAPARAPVAVPVAPKITAAPAPPPKPKRRIKLTRKQILIAIELIVGLAVLGIGLAFWILRPGIMKDINDSCEVPAGDFVFGPVEKGEKRNTKAFWISKYEVTIGQYKKFLDDVEKSGDEKFRYVNQPKNKDHVPASWNQIKNALEHGGKFNGVAISKYHPIFNIDWYDAWAFCAWAGGRLPSEDEWEKAARGTDGRLYPWGNGFSSQKLNSGEDWTGILEDSGSKDGFALWCKERDMPEDASPYGARHMAGNVSEWTSTIGQDPRFKDRSVAIIRGGNFMLKQFDITTRLNDREPRLSQRAQELVIGFRVAWDHPPSGDWAERKSP